MSPLRKNGFISVDLIESANRGGSCAILRVRPYHLLEVSTGLLIQAIGLELGDILALLLLRLNGLLFGLLFSVYANI